MTFRTSLCAVAAILAAGAAPALADITYGRSAEGPNGPRRDRRGQRQP